MDVGNNYVDELLRHMLGFNVLSTAQGCLGMGMKLTKELHIVVAVVRMHLGGCMDLLVISIGCKCLKCEMKTSSDDETGKAVRGMASVTHSLRFRWPRFSLVSMSTLRPLPTVVTGQV